MPIGASLNAIRTNLEDYLRACEAYKRKFSNVFRDPIKLRVAAHLGLVTKSMWKKYHRSECLCERQGRKCQEQGICRFCYEDFARWERQIYNIAVNH